MNCQNKSETQKDYMRIYRKTSNGTIFARPYPCNLRPPSLIILARGTLTQRDVLVKNIKQVKYKKVLHFEVLFLYLYLKKNRNMLE